MPREGGKRLYNSSGCYTTDFSTKTDRKRVEKVGNDVQKVPREGGKRLYNSSGCYTTDFSAKTDRKRLEMTGNSIYVFGCGWLACASQRRGAPTITTVVVPVGPPWYVCFCFCFFCGAHSAKRPEAPLQSVICLCAFSSQRKPAKIDRMTKRVGPSTRVMPLDNEGPSAGKNTCMMRRMRLASPPGMPSTMVERIVPKHIHAAVRAKSHAGQSAKAQ